ncbi:hypothetical protein Ddye_013569 [Dipteronia dyeriana]|uniref:Alpha/beta hydrolase fold-3 domain-containing protein n=1 Tax=Dipteronia dyeriana TaxID=168575 RepID=A0AAE0CKB7_9ROSI|nr:hypothetical protein Ddye_013569 [Dipteronia dyeriana]
MSNETAQSQSTINPYEYLQIIPNPDGSIIRKNSLPIRPATPDHDPANNIPVLTKDIIINQSNNIWVRIFLPHHDHQPLDQSSSNNNHKLPLIVYYHGGGFIEFGPDMIAFHIVCSNMAIELQTVIVSVNYRLAPEHRLPAAYDDAVEALQWIKTTQEVWLQKYADFSNCFLMGESAGANITYHVGLRAAAEVDHLLPLQIRGLILYQPFFGGIKRTDSELRLFNNAKLPLCAADLLWQLSLPLGVDRNHEYCNPTVEGGSAEVLDQIKLLRWKVMVTGCDGDPLIDRQIELVKFMEQKGVQVVGHFTAGGYHGGQFEDSSNVEALFALLQKIIFSSKMAV